MRLYLDSAPIIYAVEHVQGYAQRVDERLTDPETTVVVSDLTRLECRVKPLRDDNIDLLVDYDQFFEQAVAEIVALSRAVIDRATEIRAQHAFKTPDAIHLAAAILSGCDVFYTNDHRLDRFKDIPVEVLAVS